MTAPTDILQQIQDRLTTDTPAQIIGHLLPFTQHEAMTWARRLPLWDDFRGQYPGQAVALARVISRRAMKEFSLVFDAEGRVVQQQKHIRKKAPATTFPIQIAGETVQVKYQQHYLPNSGQDLFSFVGEPVSSDPGTIAAILHAHKPHPLSETGWLSHWAQHDAVEACGGPQRYAELYVEARMQGKDEEFTAAFEGKWPESKMSRRKCPKAEEPPVVGEHTAAVVKDQSEREEPPVQGMLFS